MGVIKKIFMDECDEEVHSAFIKFSRGDFKNKWLLEAKKQAEKWSMKTSAEFANELVEMCLEECGEKVKMSGAIISTFDMRKDKGYLFSEGEKVKQFMGVKQIIVDGEIGKDELKEIMKKYPRAFYALSFESGKSALKIKAKAPKSAKPASSGDKEVKAEFCSLKTSNKSIVNELFFDFPEFKEIKISHELLIDKIELPMGVEDPAKIRELAKRGGKVIRRAVIDEKSIVKEAKFLC